jgi:hypothetical protein
MMGAHIVGIFPECSEVVDIPRSLRSIKRPRKNGNLSVPAFPTHATPPAKIRPVHHTRQVVRITPYNFMAFRIPIRIPRSRIPTHNSIYIHSFKLNCSVRAMSTAAAPEKVDWLVVLPDHEGALARRMEVRQYVSMFSRTVYTENTLPVYGVI